MKVIANKSIETGYNIICEKTNKKIETNKEHNCFLKIKTTDKIDLSLKKKNYKPNDLAKNILFFYTFDPIKTIIQMDNNINMLLYSLLSVYNEMPESCIYLYTSKKDLMIDMTNKLNIQTLEIKEIDKTYLTDGVENKFAQIGHARIFLIPYLLKTTNKHIIYMDNDTMIRDFGRNYVLNLLKKITNPIGYMLETYITLDEWVECSSNIKDKKIIGEMCRGYSKFNTINNGLLVFPNNELSINFANQVEKLYGYYLNKYGYFYGLDMFIFSLLMHNYNFKLSNINSLMGINGLFHYNIFKLSLIIHIRDEITKYFKKNNINF